MRLLCPPTMARPLPNLSVLSHQMCLAKTLEVHSVHGTRFVMTAQEN